MKSHPSSTWLDRQRAADWFETRGVHVSKRYLEKLAHEGRGPAFCRLGSQVYYNPADLETWLTAEMRPVTAGRQAASPGLRRASAS